MIKILGNRVLIKRLDPPKTTSSIIEVVELNPDPSQYGKVLAFGDVPDIKVGDIVLIGKYSGAIVPFDGDEAVIVSGDDLLAVIEK